MTENVEKFLALLDSDPEIAKRFEDAKNAYPGSWEIREPFLAETMLPLAESLGLGFTLAELRKVETRRKLSHLKDEADPSGEVPDETVYYLLDQGWEDDPDIFKKDE